MIVMHAVRSFLRLDGVMSRGQYVSLFLVKYVLDALVVRSLFGKRWMPWDYLNVRWREIDWQNHGTVAFACLMFALASRLFGVE